MDNLLAKVFVDYIFLIVPIFISIVALIVSIVGIRKQNQIALFEIRHKAFFALKQMANFGETLSHAVQPISVIKAYELCFVVEVNIKDRVNALTKNGTQINKLEEAAGALFDILRPIDRDIIKRTISKLTSVFNDAVMDEINKENIEDLKALCVILEKVTLPRLKKKIRI